MLELAKGSLEGVYFTNIQYFPDAPTSEKMKSFVANYQREFGDTRNYICVYGYDIINYLIQAIKDGGYSADGIKKALIGKRLELVRGNVVVPPNLDIQVPLVVCQVKQGKFQIVYNQKGD